MAEVGAARAGDSWKMCYLNLEFVRHARTPSSTGNARSGSETEQHRDPGTGAGAARAMSVHISVASCHPPECAELMHL